MLPTQIHEGTPHSGEEDIFLKRRKYRGDINYKEINHSSHPSGKPWRSVARFLQN